MYETMVFWETAPIDDQPPWIVDFTNLFLWPVVLGGGKNVLPRHARLDLQLLTERRTSSGVVHLHYRMTN